MRFLREFMARDSVLFAISMLVAILFVTSVYRDSDIMARETRTVTMRYTPNVGDNFVVVSEPIDVAVTLDGAKWRFQDERNFMGNFPEIPVAVTAGVEEYDVPWPLVPAGVKVKDLRPGKTTLDVRRRLETTVRVVPRITGEPAAGFVSDVPIVTPSVLTVFVPEGVDMPDYVETKPIDVTGAESTRTVDVMEPVFPPHMKPLADASSVRVEVPIAPRVDKRLLGPIPVEVRGVPRHLQVQIDPPLVSLLIRAPNTYEPRAKMRAVIDFTALDGAAVGEIGRYPGIAYRLDGLPNPMPADVSFEAMPQVVTVTVTARDNQ